MKFSTISSLFAVLVLSYSASTLGHAQQANPDTPNETERNWYYGSDSPVVAKKTIAQQKAETKARQRTARLETYRWLGYSPSRPPAPVNPFTSSNSLNWKKAERSHSYIWNAGYRPRYYYQSQYRFY